MKIAIDLDRTIFDCSSLIFSLGNLLNTKKNLNTPLKYKEVDKDKALSYFNTLFFIKMSHPGNFYEKQNSTEILRKWNEQGIDITFLSSRPNYKSFNKAIVKWLKDHGVEYEKLILGCNNKPKYCRFNNYDLLIDDTMQNCIHTSAFGVPSIWYINEYNYKQIENLPENIKFSVTWNGIDDIVQQLYEKNKSTQKQPIIFTEK